jgi:hypothetical protein
MAGKDRFQNFHTGVAPATIGACAPRHKRGVSVALPGQTNSPPRLMFMTIPIRTR